MESLIIKQSTALLETVNNSIIHSLYINAKTLKDTNKLVTLEGNLLSSSAYEDEVSYLTTTFPNLYITASTLYVSFEDPEVERLLKSYGYGDSTGIRTTDLLTITRLRPSGPFASSNSTIESFDELSRFINLTRIYSSDFSLTIHFTSINLSNIERIDEMAFYGSAITTVNAPNLSTLLPNAFNSAKIITITSLGEVTEIPTACFISCSRLTSVNMPSTCISIELQAFKDCSSLLSIDLSNVTSIGVESFRNCAMLSVDLSSATTINGSAFRDCSSLLSVTLGEGLVKISGYAFNNCPLLTSINIPSSVKIINDLAFSATSANLLHGSDIYYVESVQGHSSNGNGAFAVGSFANEDLVLPNLKTTDGGAFSKCAFKSFSAPNIETITKDTAVLANNNVVTKIHLNPNVTIVPSYSSRGGGMFAICSNLTKVTGLSSLTVIPPGAFNRSSSILYLDIDFSNIVELCNNIFSFENLNNNINNFKTIGDKVFDFSNLVNPTATYNGTTCKAYGLFTCCNISHLCFPKLKYTFTTQEKNAYSGPARTFFAASTRSNRIRNLYFRDIENFGAGTFASSIIDNLYIDNITPPGIIASTGNFIQVSAYATANTDIFCGLHNKSSYTNSGITVLAIKIYVPDSAVSTYLANPLYASVASNIVGISTAPHIAAADVTDIIDPDDNDPTITYGKACSVDGLLPGYY